ncbi:ABC transporter substrate-binding protein [Streptomyces sp. 15-116A]|uniref:ABC transporter substrate-binding protein n=1 Tax=Streptomyces sp. 15-116A TaxID=2259035 RepID=UPI0021B27C50|nr:ABC transporter substrate-binding protein [Streptomyces sp. 15-116A]MCT7352754.1 ABC transporter substrate-binding protein [Streptomyces sp. 15-116A]
MNLRNQWPVLPIVAGLASGLLTGCGSENGDSGADGSNVVVGMSDDVLATDPASGYDPGSWLLFNNVFQSLLSFPKGATEPQPEAAEDCSFNGTETKVYTCTLKDGLKFSNGDELTSKDVKFSFDRMLKIDDPDGPAIMFPTLDKVEAPDDKTVVFHLNTPDATFPSKIASGAGSIVNHREYDANGLRKDGQAIGSGPYKLDSFSEDEAVFSVNEHYKGTVEPKNSGVTLKFFHGDQDALKKAVQDAEVDVAYRGLTAQAITDIEKSDDGTGTIEVIEGSSAEVQHLVFNMDDPVAGKLGVRKAIAHLLDREALIQDVYQGTATPLYSIIPAGIAGHNTAFFDTYGARPSKAKAAAALAEEGITGKVKLTLWSTPSRYGPATDQELAAIAKQLNASGLFDAEMKSVDFEQYEKDIAAGKYGVYVKGWVPDYPDADNFTGPFFGKGNVLNNNYENSRITGSLIPATAAQGDRSATDKEFGELQDIVAEELPVLPVWQAKQYAVVRDGVYGLEYCLDASTVFRFWELSKSEV